jgi:adenosine deaminase
MPKVELHCHLEGCVRPATFIELARTHAVPLPTTDRDRVYAYADMATFMVVFERLAAAVVTREDFRRITYEALVDAARGSGVVYREMFFNPTLHPALSYDELLAGITDGAEEARRETGIVTRLIPSVYRAHSPAAATDMVRAVARGDRSLVVGIGMDGDETAGPPASFTEAYALARDAGLQVTAHAGERFSGQEVRDCLDLLGCTRIDHGYGIVREPDLLARVRDTGTHVTCAWLSTTYNYRGPAREHPIRLLHDAGISMSLGSDDPAMGGTDLAADYGAVVAELGLTEDDLAQHNRDALDAAWLPPDEKAAVRARLDAALARPPEAAPLGPAAQSADCLPRHQ